MRVLGAAGGSWGRIWVVKYYFYMVLCYRAQYVRSKVVTFEDKQNNLFNCLSNFVWVNGNFDIMEAGLTKRLLLKWKREIL